MVRDALLKIAFLQTSIKINLKKTQKTVKFVTTHFMSAEALWHLKLKRAKCLSYFPHSHTVYLNIAGGQAFTVIRLEIATAVPGCLFSHWHRLMMSRIASTANLWYHELFAYDVKRYICIKWTMFLFLHTFILVQLNPKTLCIVKYEQKHPI